MALRIQRTSSTYLTLEFRQPSGTFDDFPATSLMATGVIVRVTPGYTTRSQSQLVDTTPGSTSFGDALLAVGGTLTDPLTGVSITTLAVAPTGATVRVTFGGGLRPRRTRPPRASPGTCRRRRSTRAAYRSPGQPARTTSA